MSDSIFPISLTYIPCAQMCKIEMTRTFLTLNSLYKCTKASKNSTIIQTSTSIYTYHHRSEQTQKNGKDEEEGGEMFVLIEDEQ